MVTTVVLIFCLTLPISFALNPNYRECAAADDCSFYDFPDPRNDVMDLYLSIEDNMEKSVAMPDFELYARFHSGNLVINEYDPSDLLCNCPVTNQSDQIYNVIHDDILVSITYNWTLKLGPVTRDGILYIVAELPIHVYFINETNGVGPNIDRINVTSSEDNDVWMDGQPLEAFSEIIPFKLLQKTVEFVVKRTYEERFESMFNDAIRKMKGNFQIPSLSKRLSTSRNKRRNTPHNSIQLMDFFKPRRNANLKFKKSKYMY